MGNKESTLLEDGFKTAATDNTLSRDAAASLLKEVADSRGISSKESDFHSSLKESNTLEDVRAALSQHWELAQMSAAVEFSLSSQKTKAREKPKGKKPKPKPASALVEPLQLGGTFRWDARNQTYGCFLIPRDIWIIILEFLDSLRDLHAVVCSHPFLYDAAATSSELRERLTVPTFFNDHQKTPVKLTDNSRTAWGPSTPDKTLTSTSVSEGAVTVSFPKVSPESYAVHLLLRSDFLTETYVSYFNMMVTLGTQPLFHYFVDGDLWNVNYRHHRRSLAKWKEGDVISIKLEIIDEDEYTEFDHDHIIHLQVAPLPGKSQGGFNLPKNRLSERHSRVCISLYKNYSLVHDPMILPLGVVGPFYVRCRLIEPKDCVQLIRGKPVAIPRKVTKEN